MVYVAEPWGASSDGHMLFMCEDEFHRPAVTLHYMQSGVTCSTLSVCRLMFQRDFTCLQEDINWRLMFHLLLELKIRLCFFTDFPPCLSSFDIFPPVFFYCHDSLISVLVPPPAVFYIFFLIFNLALRPLVSPLICSQLEDAGSSNDVDGWSLCPARSAVTAWPDSVSMMNNLEGLEMIAVLVVIVAFVKVLEQFGLLEPSYYGKIREDVFKLFTSKNWGQNLLCKGLKGLY